MVRLALLVMLLGPLLGGCGGAGPWGYARRYEPLDPEEAHLQRAVPLSYEDARRFPDRYAGTFVGWFGTVEAMEPLQDGRLRLVLRFRTHQARHLCADERASSCRVTVTDRVGEPFVAVVRPRPEQLRGPDRLWKKSLVRVYGPLRGELDEERQVPVVEAVYFRHWPVGRYVTTAMRGAMRQ